MTPLDVIVRYRFTALWCSWVAYVAIVLHVLEVAR